MGDEPTEALDWFENIVLSRLSYKQDFDVVDIKVKQVEGGIEVARWHLRLFSTGIDKMHRLLVLREDLPIIDDEDERAQEGTDAKPNK